MIPLLLAALLAQAGDAATTCAALRRGGVEQNPVYGQSCARVVAVKAASMAGIALVPNRKVKVVLSAYALGHGGVGLTVNLSRR